MDRREHALRAYFSAAPAKPRVIVEASIAAGGLFLLLSGLSLLSSSGGCAAVLAAPGLIAISCALIVMGFKWSAYTTKRRDMQSQPQDVEVQQWLDESMNRERTHALQALGIEGEELISDLLTIISPILWRTNGIDDNDLVWRRGLDNVVRLGVYRLTLIALTEHHFGVFTCDYNFIKDIALNQKTSEYHYRDIVAVSTAEESSSLSTPSGEKITTVQEFRVSVASGEAIRITVDAPQIRQMAGLGSLPASGAEKAVRAIRAMLRTKKE